MAARFCARRSVAMHTVALEGFRPKEGKAVTTALARSPRIAAPLHPITVLTAKRATAGFWQRVSPLVRSKVYSKTLDRFCCAGHGVAGSVVFGRVLDVAGFLICLSRR